MVPDLDHLAVREAENVDAGKPHGSARRSDAGPGAVVRARRSPAGDDHVALADEEVDLPAQVWKRRAEVAGDALLALGAGLGLTAAEVVANVLVREDLVGDVEIPARPDLLVETPDQRLVLVDAHPPSMSGEKSR